MTVEEIYDTIDLARWKELTEKENPVQNMTWSFHRPINKMDGLFMLEYTDKRSGPMEESGNFYIDRVSEKKYVITIKETQFTFSFGDSYDEMIWYKYDKVRTFKREITPDV